MHVQTMSTRPFFGEEGLLDKRRCAAKFCNNESLQPYIDTKTRKKIDTKARNVRGNGREGRVGGNKGGEMAQENRNFVS